MKRSASATATAERVGILNIDKPLGWTSHDVVARVRRLADQRRVGHAGTLDPLASGVLPVLLGRATRLADVVQSGSKTYVADVRLGLATTTDDAEGCVVATAPVPDFELEPRLARFRGPILQTPPQYSAIKVAGQRAYAAARRGQDLDLRPRPVTIHELRLLNAADDTLTLEVTCSTGTYIRALARDLAIALGTVGHLTRLVRTRVGNFHLADASPLEGVTELPPVLPPDRALMDCPEFRADLAQAARLERGQAIASNLHAEAVRVYDPSGRLLGVASADGTQLRPRFLL